MASGFWKVEDRIQVSHRARRRVRRGHPWVYRSDISSAVSGPPRFVVVTTDDGQVLGQAMLSPASQITLRMVTRPEQEVSAALFGRRLANAHQRRRHLLPDADAFRVVHGEADGLPGIFVDQYREVVSLQTTCGAADRLEPELVDMIEQQLSPRTIVVRDDASARQREGLLRHVTVAKGPEPGRAVFREGPVELTCDLLGDQKTGAFLDQSLNHQRVGQMARGRGLDCFCYHGGFALQMARRCQRVTAADSSTPALARAAEHARRNGLDNLELVAEDVFDWLPRLKRAGERFDTIVLDPPAFASTQKTVGRACRAYREINRRAIELLASGGILITCSCSGRVTAEAFDQVIEAAARAARRPLWWLEKRGAGPDHPVLVGVPETEYLKCRILMAG